MFVPASAGKGVKIGNMYSNGKSSKGKGKGKSNGPGGASQQGDQDQKEDAVPAVPEPMAMFINALQAMANPNPQTPKKTAAQADPQTPSTAATNATPSSTTSPPAATDTNPSKGEEPDNAYQRWRDKKSADWKTESEPEQRPPFARRFRQRESATESKWGKPQWYLSARCFQDEGVDGSIKIDTDRESVYARCEHDWAGIHLRGMKVENLMESSKELLDDTAELRILAMAFTAQETKHICHDNGQVLVLSAVPKGVDLLTKVLGQIHWAFPYDTNAEDLNRVLIEYAQRWGLSPASEMKGGDDETEALRQARDQAQMEKTQLMTEMMKMRDEMYKMKNVMAAQHQHMGNLEQMNMNAAINHAAAVTTPHSAWTSCPPPTSKPTYPSTHQALGTSLWDAPSMPTQDSASDDTLPTSASSTTTNTGGWKKITSKTDDPPMPWPKTVSTTWGTSSRLHKTTLSPEKKPTKEIKDTKDAKVMKTAEAKTKRHLTRASCREMRQQAEAEQEDDQGANADSARAMSSTDFPPTFGGDTQAWFPPAGGNEEDSL